MMRLIDREPECNHSTQGKTANARIADAKVIQKRAYIGGKIGDRTGLLGRGRCAVPTEIRHDDTVAAVHERRKLRRPGQPKIGKAVK
jgi:hypothetical protein